MSHSGNRGRLFLLLAACALLALLLGLTVTFLVDSSPQEPPTEDRAGNTEAPGQAPGPSRAPRAEPVTPGQARPRRPWAGREELAVLPADVRAILAAAAPPAEEARPPAAPADPSAEPEYIQLEPDPKVKARLRKMHEMTQSTVLMVRQEETAKKLARELAAAEASGAWTQQQLQRARQDLEAAQQEAARTKNKVEALVEVVRTYAVHIPMVYEENDELRKGSGSGSAAGPAPR